MRKDPRVDLAQILECANKIERYLAGGKQAFLTETMAQDAVIRNFEVIGEAAKRWEIATRDLPPVRDAIAGLLPPLDQLERELAGDDEGGKLQ